MKHVCYKIKYILSKKRVVIIENSVLNDPFEVLLSQFLFPLFSPLIVQLNSDQKIRKIFETAD